MFYSPPLYTVYNIWHTAHCQSSLSFRYYFIPFKTLNSLLLLSFFSPPFFALSICRSSHPYSLVIESASTEEAASKVVSEVDRALLAHIMKAVKTTNFRAHFNISRLYVKLFLKWIMFSNTVLAKKNYGRDKIQSTQTFKAIKAISVCKLLCSQSIGDRHRTGLEGATSIPRCCLICEKRSSRARVLLYPLPRRLHFCSTSQWGSVSADSSQLCAERLSCFTIRHHPISSRVPNVLSQYSHGRKTIRKRL